MNGDALDVLQRRLPVRAIFDDLVVRAGLHAMRRRQHQFRRDQRAGAEIAARADDGDDRARHAFRRRRAAADDGVRGNGQQQRKAGNQARQDFHRRSNNPRGACRQAPDRTGSSGNSVLAAPQRISFQAGNDDRGSDLGFRRGADHLAVRGVCAVRDRARAARRHHPAHQRRQPSGKRLGEVRARRSRYRSLRRVVRGRIAGAGRGGSRQGRAAAAVGRSAARNGRGAQAREGAGSRPAASPTTFPPTPSAATAAARSMSPK